MPLYSLKDVPTPSRYPRPPDYKYMILSTAVIKYIIANTNLPIQNVPRGTLEKSGGCSTWNTSNLFAPPFRRSSAGPRKRQTMPTTSACRNLRHAYLVDSAAGQVELAIRGRHHIADHSATGRYRGSPKLLGARVESHESVGCTPDSLYQTMPSDVTAIP